ncbi:MAG: hypothetical protein NXI24_08520 [bacterium]|nr:hypothetical protein [bacterium]
MRFPIQHRFQDIQTTRRIRFFAAAIGIAIATGIPFLLTGTAALIAEDAETPGQSESPANIESTDAKAPDLLLCEKAVQCEAEAKDDPGFMKDCAGFVERAQVYPRAAGKMTSCAKASACEDYKFTNCIEVYAGELSAAGVPEAEFREILTGRKRPAIATPSAEQLAAFESLCTTVVRCDAQTQSFPDPIKICMQFMVSIEAKFPDKLPGFRACLGEQSCEEQNLALCLADIARDMETEPPPGAEESDAETKTPPEGADGEGSAQ